MRVERHIIIRRPIAEVFAFAAHYENDPLWSGAILEAQRVTTAETQSIGTIFRRMIELAGLCSLEIAMVVEYEMNRRVMLKTLSGPQPYSDYRMFEPVSEGTRVTFAIEGTPTRYWQVDAAALGDMIIQRIEHDLACLKAILEAA